MRRPGLFARLWARLLGFREVERSERSVVLRLPWYVTGGAVERVEAGLRADARLAWPGDELRIERGDRLIRLTRVPSTVSDAAGGYDAGHDDPRDRSAHAAPRLGDDQGDEAGRESRREPGRRVDRS